MKKINIIGLFFLVFFSILGIISIILFTLGFRPIKENDVKPNWEAISSIATIFAVITALFITKYQNYLENKKELSIWWLHTELRETDFLTYPGFTSLHRLDYICIKFVNTGNRKIILSCVKILFPSKESNILTPERIKINNFLPQISLPYILEPENVCFLFVPMSGFLMAIKKFIKDAKVTENNEIILIVEDTTSKEYKYNTKLEYQSYLKLNNQQARHQ